MQRISLTRGLVALIDEADFAIISEKKWRAQKNYSTYYALSTDDCYMHRFLCSCPEGFVVDHINGNGLDNRRINLRAVPMSINRLNSKLSSNNTSGYRGVTKAKTAGKWVAQLTFRLPNGGMKKNHLGTFTCPYEAHLAYLDAVKRFYGSSSISTRN